MSLKTKTVNKGVLEGQQNKSGTKKHHAKKQRREARNQEAQQPLKRANLKRKEKKATPIEHPFARGTKG